ncbi:Thiol reductase thioredoxin [Luteimonas sp. 9C]|uniref:thioredoxin family protein n=1 Tax=Luteimonas sp. 9C TaxID=2653148 RepID=UPI0012F290AD|nr:thioredoxin family protein [Luteimonas sp. 9C]VXC01972.1 Thiol reductase thioredoxin [Luteimonas sp. 9C]
MDTASGYRAEAPPRDAIDAQRGPLVIEFGTDWCGHCQAAQPAIAAALAGHGPVDHLKIEDGKGRPLGRSFSVKLWPTLIVMRDGVERARVVRPTDAADVEEALRTLD